MARARADDAVHADARYGNLRYKVRLSSKARRTASARCARERVPGTGASAGAGRCLSVESVPCGMGMGGSVRTINLQTTIGDPPRVAWRVVRISLPLDRYSERTRVL